MKTSIDVDRAVAEQAAKLLGTETLRDTVDAALREVIALDQRRRLAARIRARTLPVPSAAELARLRKPRVAAASLSREQRKK